MARDRDDVMTLVSMIAHAAIVEDGVRPNSQMALAEVRQWFDVAEMIIDERDRRYPSAQPPAGR